MQAPRLKDSWVSIKRAERSKEILVRMLPKDATGYASPPPLVTSLKRLNLFSTLIKASSNHHLRVRASEFILDAN